MSKVISHTNLSKTLALSECNDGWWLYDHTRGMNLSIRVKSKDNAFVEALEYYQNRLKEVESAYASLSEKVNTFCYSIFGEED